MSKELTIAFGKGWSRRNLTQKRLLTRVLYERINSQLFERTATSKKPELTIINELNKRKESGSVNQDLLLKDPYILDFLELNDTYLEKDLEEKLHQAVINAKRCNVN